MPRLIILNPSLSDSEYELAETTVHVGRDATNHLVIRDTEVSRFHCEILSYRLEVLVRDLGSRNGTVVNGKRVRNGQAPLHHGQILQVGTVQARLDLDPLPDDPLDGDASTIIAAKPLPDGSFPARKVLTVPVRMTILGDVESQPEEPTGAGVAAGVADGPSQNKKDVAIQRSRCGPVSRALLWVMGFLGKGV